MNDIRGASLGFSGKVKSSSYKKYLVLTLFVLVLFFLFSGGFGLLGFLDKDSVKETDAFCGDRTMYNSCSSTQPYFCKSGKLITLPSVCGCPDGFDIKEEICLSPYQTDAKRVYLNYTLRGERHVISFIVYGGFEEYISEVPRSIYYASKSNSSRVDFTLKAINEEEQKKFLMPLVVKIQNLTNNKDDQMRIAISIVQNIPFGQSNKTIIFGNTELNYSRYPYEVLYEMEGICGEKTDLLAFLLRELGYSTSFFYYPDENHEALGIKCPIEESLMRSEYCFIETTGPSIITDNQISYVGVGKLLSRPEVYLINYGRSIGSNIEEYDDADRLINIRDSIEKTGLLGPMNKKMFEKIKVKYGLADSYYG